VTAATHLYLALDRMRVRNKNPIINPTTGPAGAVVPNCDVHPAKDITTEVQLRPIRIAHLTLR
jgi:hypothetical protein